MNNVEQHDAVCKELNQLYKLKNQDYGDSFHETFIEEGMAMARIRLTDKLNRFKKLTKHESAQNVTDESVRDTLIDLANYAIMTVMELDREVPFMSKTDTYDSWVDKVIPDRAGHDSVTVRDGMEDAVSKTGWVNPFRSEWERMLNDRPISRCVQEVKDRMNANLYKDWPMSKTDMPMSKTDYTGAECDWVRDDANDMD